jgi:ABC-2 type transport system ATP-binding protein
MLKVENVTKYYGSFRAVHNLSFEIHEGEIFGLLGVNGAGKTTTFRMILGLLDKTEGSITLNDKPIDYTVTDNIGFLTEERSLLPEKTVLEQAIFYCALKGLSKEETEKRLDKYLEEFKVSEYKNKKIKELSKGNQQKIQFILSIIHKPKLLILDEPTNGLDPIGIKQLRELLINLSRNSNVGILISSHNLPEIENICDRILMVDHGTIIEDFGIEKVKYKNISLEEEFMNKLEGDKND